MILDSWQEAELILNLMEEFGSSGLDTKRVIYGHNWENLQYARDILIMAQRRPHIEGVALNSYKGDFKATRY